MYYDWNYAFFGMNLLWWLFWVVMIVAVFSWATPVPRRRMKLYEHPLSILQRRYAAGELTTQEYDERKARIDADMRELAMRGHADVAYRGPQASTHEVHP